MKKMKNIGKILSGFMLLIFVTQGHAAKKQDDMQWYLVEIAVFSHIDANAIENERWPEDPGTMGKKRLIELIPARGDARTNPETEQDKVTGKATEKSSIDTQVEQETSIYPEAFQMLYPDELQLTAKLSQLRRSKNYRLLLHTAWYQPAFETRHKRSVYLHDNLRKSNNSYKKTIMPMTDAGPTDGPLNQRLFGTFRLTISRYLHAHFDMLFRLPQEVTYHEEKEMLQDAVFLLPPDMEFDYETTPTTTMAMINYRLKEARRIKSKEIHYFDHPAFGILLHVTPYELPEEGNN